LYHCFRSTRTLVAFVPLLALMLLVLLSVRAQRCSCVLCSNSTTYTSHSCARQFCKIILQDNSLPCNTLPCYARHYSITSTPQLCSSLFLSIPNCARLSIARSDTEMDDITLACTKATSPLQYHARLSNTSKCTDAF
jgi:hypothetical protein